MKSKFKAAVLSLLMAFGGHAGVPTADAATGTGDAPKSSYVVKSSKKSGKMKQGKKRVKRRAKAKTTNVQEQDPFSAGVPSKRPFGTRRKGRKPNEIVVIDTIPDKSLQKIVTDTERD